MTEPWPWATCTNYLVKFGRVVFKICERTDMLIAILGMPTGGKVTEEITHWSLSF